MFSCILNVNKMNSLYYIQHDNLFPDTATLQEMMTALAHSKVLREHALSVCKTHPEIPIYVARATQKGTRNMLEEI